MATLEELKAERAKMDRLREDASWQDFYLPKGFWPRYREVDAEIERIERVWNAVVADNPNMR